MRHHDHKRLLSEVKAVVEDLETARILLIAVYSQWVRNGRLTPLLGADVKGFLDRSQRTERQS